MALTDDNGMVMPVAPMYGGGMMGGGNGMFGGDNWAWIVLLLILAWNNNGNNNNGGGGSWGGQPIIINEGSSSGGGAVQRGFDQAAIISSIGNVSDGINGLAAQLCNGFAQAEIAANSRQMADMNQMFNLSTQFGNCCCEQRLGIANLGALIQSEDCATRQTIDGGIRDVIVNQNNGIQRILDKLCDQELYAERRENENLRTQLNLAALTASQIDQTAQLKASQVAQVDALYNRLATCPVGTMPVYGNQPIFTNNNNGCNGCCGCGGF